MKPGAAVLLLASLALPACATSGRTPPMTQLQLREFQTRSFDAADSKLVLKALVNVLMDDGFIVQVASSDLGVLTASKQIGVENRLQAFAAKLLRSGDARWDKTEIIEVTANVSERGRQTRVRANFQLKRIDNKGVVAKIRTLGDAAAYGEFFARVDKSIFIEKERF